MATYWALVEKGSSKIMVTAKNKEDVVKKAQPFINRNPRKKYRYMKIVVDPDMPWFKKGE